MYQFSSIFHKFSSIFDNFSDSCSSNVQDCYDSFLGFFSDIFRLFGSVVCNLLLTSLTIMEWCKKESWRILKNSKRNCNPDLINSKGYRMSLNIVWLIFVISCWKNGINGITTIDSRRSAAGAQRSRIQHPTFAAESVEAVNHL